MNSRKLPILIFLMLTSLSLTGCIGDTQPETEEGDPVSLGESADDWPTYYVASSANLPTCPGANDENLGKLYYVEDVTEFQACTSSGWTTINIGSSGSSTISLNQPPRITAQIMALDDDIHNFSINNWSFVGLAHWSAIDPEGETVTVGIDADRDGTIDLNLNSSEGASIVELPWNGSIQVTQIEVGGERHLHLFRIFDVIAEDASGAISTISVISTAMEGPGIHDIFDADDASDNDFRILFPTVPQADIDWVTTSNAANPACGPNDGYVHNTFGAEDASAFLSGATDDTMIRLSWTCADFDINWADTVIRVSTSNGSSMDVHTCVIASNANGNVKCLIMQTGDSDSHWETDEIIYLKEGGSDLCTSSCDINIDIIHNGQTLSGTTTATVA